MTANLGQASRVSLTSAKAGANTPAFLFSAGHAGDGLAEPGGGAATRAFVLVLVLEPRTAQHQDEDEGQARVARRSGVPAWRD